MQWVKLIGGAHDGRVQKVDDDQIELFMQEHVPVATRAFAGRASLVAAATTAKRSHYTRRVVATPDDTISYFALIEMSDSEALRHALAP